MRGLLFLASFFVVLGGAPACQGSPDAARTLDVFAAASLRESFQTLADAFEAAHPGVTVRLTFAGSQDLRTQIEHGAAADVFASADHEPMNALLGAKRVEAPAVFAKNRLVIVTPRDNAVVTSLATLPDAKRIVVGAPAVPIGRYTQRLLETAAKDPTFGADFATRVEARIVSREANVRQVLAKVTLGEADAAVVYRTDAAVAKDVRVVELPRELAFQAEYPIAVVVGSHAPELARSWVDFVRSTEGQVTLARAGFEQP